MKKLLFITISLLLTACTTGTPSEEAHEEVMENMVANMPCHQMPDGSMMGNCEGENSSSSQQGMGMGMGMMANQQGETFSQDTSGLPEVKPTTEVELQDGDVYEMTASIVKKEVDGKELRMLAYNGSIPGPTIRVAQGAKITLQLRNELDVETLFHSHGLRLVNRFDGTQVTQDPIRIGDTFTYELSFPDAGIYWYHPHLREDYTQESGLYGNYIVEPADEDYWSPVDREVTLVLDDLLLADDQLKAFYKDFGNHTLMGRFGNLMFTNGESDYEMVAQQGEILRLYITNVSNTRTYQFAIPGIPLKLVATDVSKYEQEEMVESVRLSPSERQVVEIALEDAGSFEMVNEAPAKTTPLGILTVTENANSKDLEQRFSALRINQDVIQDIDQFREIFAKEPDKTIKLGIDMFGMGMMMGMMDHQDDGIEWEDAMPVMNANSTSETLTWEIIDEETGQKNMDIDWSFTKGDVVKIRIFNDPNSMHPMQHPFHIHGQRFLVLSTNGVANNNLAWKDTALIRTGDTVDLLVEMSNPGEWMAHCHIAEHLESSMMMSFEVSP